MAARAPAPQVFFRALIAIWRGIISLGCVGGRRSNLTVKCLSLPRSLPFCFPLFPLSKSLPFSPLSNFSSCGCSATGARQCQNISECHNTAAHAQHTALLFEHQDVSRDPRKKQQPCSDGLWWMDLSENVGKIWSEVEDINPCIYTHTSNSRHVHTRKRVCSKCFFDHRCTPSRQGHSPLYFPLLLRCWFDNHCVILGLNDSF